MFIEYVLRPHQVYLPVGLVLLQLFIFSFLLRKVRNKFSHKYHLFPAVSFTAFVGGILFLLFDIYQVKAGFMWPVIISLSFVLVMIWMAAKILLPLPVSTKSKTAALTVRRSETAIDELGLVDISGLDRS